MRLRRGAVFSFMCRGAAGCLVLGRRDIWRRGADAGTWGGGECTNVRRAVVVGRAGPPKGDMPLPMCWRPPATAAYGCDPVALAYGCHGGMHVDRIAARSLCRQVACSARIPPAPRGPYRHMGRMRPRAGPACSLPQSPHPALAHGPRALARGCGTAPDRSPRPPRLNTRRPAAAHGWTPLGTGRALCR